jgi:hypothetical protein
LEELDALPLPAWGTFLGIVLGALGALSGVVYGVLFGSDHRWALLVLAVAWTVLGAALTAAAVRLRRHEPIAAAVVYLGSSACVAGGLALLACGAARNGAILAVLGLALAVGATLELRGGVTSARYPARHG